jgi:lipid-binding SYLF domain-containing protein
VLLVRENSNGTWLGPGFYTMGEGSFGLQAGGDAAEAVSLVMTDRGVSALLSNSLKLGVNASVAAGPFGAGGELATANLSGDIISYVRTAGLYGGLSLNGAVIASRKKMNTAYYGQPVSTLDIFVRHTVGNPRADHLIAAVATTATPK